MYGIPKNNITDNIGAYVPDSIRMCAPHVRYHAAPPGIRQKPHTGISRIP